MRKSAYSIIEILISSLISAIVLAVSVPSYTFFENFKLRREAYNLALAIRSSQIKAINEGITYTTELVNHNSIDKRPFYSISNYSNTNKLKIYLSDNIRFSKEDAQYITYGANGYIDGGSSGRITLENNLGSKKKKINIIITPCIGMVRVSQQNMD